MPGLANFIIDHINRGTAANIAADPTLAGNPAQMDVQYTQQTGLPAGDLFGGAKESALAQLATNPDFIAKPYQDQLVDLAKIDPANAVSNLQKLAQNKAMWGAYAPQTAGTAPASPQYGYGRPADVTQGDAQPNAAVPQGPIPAQGYGAQSQYPALSNLAQIGATTGLFSPTDAVGMLEKQTGVAKNQADINALNSQVPKNQAEAIASQESTLTSRFNRGENVAGSPGAAGMVPAAVGIQLPPASLPPAMRGLPQGGGMPAIPQVGASALQPSLSGPATSGDGTSAVLGGKAAQDVVKAGATKSVETNAENLGEAQKTYNVMNANFPNMMQRIQDMSDANKVASFQPIANDKEGDGLITAYEDSKLGDPKVAAANAMLQQRAAQGVLPELGPALSQAGIKGNKFLETLANQANNIDLSKGQVGRQTQIDGLMKAYLQNMKSQHDQIAGYGGTPTPLPAPAVAQAVKYGVMSRDEARKYLNDNHGMPLQ